MQGTTRLPGMRFSTVCLKFKTKACMKHLYKACAWQARIANPWAFHEVICEQARLEAYIRLARARHTRRKGLGSSMQCMLQVRSKGNQGLHNGKCKWRRPSRGHHASQDFALLLVMVILNLLCA